MTKKAKIDLPVKLFTHQRAWETWLGKHFDSSAGLWVRIGKKGTDIQSVTYQEALESALCYGWIDGQKKTFDDKTWLQRFTPRGPKSIWSKINRAKALELIKLGRMRKPGLVAIETAKENGRWDAAYDSHRTASPPLDFKKSLSKNPKAKAFFATLNSQNRYSILFRIQTAKKAETRKDRINKFVRMLEMHGKLYP
ncbi:MAG TPA: YdeI/OmpD-associated family protein [Bacteroidota bacterium]|nr:YdeI/OmpD-associated family protein [Bacteroidota bacterium]